MTADKNLLESKVNQWIRDAFANDNLKKIDLKITGTSEKGDGYLGDIIFINLSAATSTDQTKEYDLVLKCGKLVEGARQTVLVHQAFKREIFVYSEAVPLFSQFEQTKGVKLSDYILPRCFSTLLYDNEEIIVLQNLRSLGYVVHDEMIPLDINHLKLTLDNYGKWHGLSLAYRNQHPAESRKLFDNLTVAWGVFLSSTAGFFDTAEIALYDLLERNKELELANRLRRRFTKGYSDTLLELISKKEENCVLVHGDCWNNNIMFKYDDLKTERPVSALFLDFQLSSLGSPVLDLAYHLYSTASEEQLRHFKELFKFYHSSLSMTIRELGSDPEKLFPYSELIRQWRVYSFFGIICLSLVVTMVLSKEDIRDIHDMTGSRFNEVLAATKGEKDNLIFQRAVASR